MEAYSLDLRKRVLAACDAGHGTKQVAETFGVSSSWVRRLKQRRRELGTIAPLPPRYGSIPKFTPKDLQRLADLVAEQPDATLAELKERLGLDVTLKSICVRLQQMKLRVKKKSSTPASRTDRTSRPCERSGTSNSTA
jgi:transposase